MCFVLWLFGVPGSGKTSIARALGRAIGQTVEVIDGDDVRGRVTPSPTWSDHERETVYRALAEIASRLATHDVSSVIAASGGGVDIDEIRGLLPSPNALVHVSCDLDVAMRRRPHGVYDACLKADIRLPLIRVSHGGAAWDQDLKFCARHSIRAYELRLPKRIDITLDTNLDSIADSVDVLQKRLRILGLLPSRADT